MALTGKLEAELEITSSGDLFHALLSNAPHEMSNIHPELLQSCDLHEGEFGEPGYVVVWNYTIDGTSYTAKEKFEIIDEENKIVKLVVVEGDILEEYKSFEVTIQVLPKDEGLNIVKWTIDYEKLHEGVTDPHKLLDAAIDITKKIDDHHLQL